jgi:DNA-binding LacI/PurR family transcriptional regulator
MEIIKIILTILWLSVIINTQMATKMDNMVITSQHRKDVDLRKFIHRQLMGLKASQPLPSVREIMRDCNVSQARVEDLLDQLQHQGLIERIPRRGTFKRDGAESAARFIPMIDIIYCGMTYDLHAIRMGFHPEMVDALARQVSQRHQGIRVHQFPVGSSSREFAALFSKPDLQACIMVGLENPEIIKTAQEHQLAWVSLFPQTLIPADQTILINADEVVRKQLEHLWQLGHQRIAYLHVVDEKVYHRDLLFRREAFYKLMAERGLQVRPNWVVYGDYFEEPFMKNFTRLFEEKPYPTAVILADHHLAWAYRVLKEKGLQVGKDISVVGTDDLAIAAGIDPPATTLRVSRVKAAEMALDMLDRVLAGQSGIGVEYLPVELIIRGSTVSPEEK